MTVRCCRTYEEVHEGDVGKVIKAGLFFVLIDISEGVQCRDQVWFFMH